jgi:hypothetical protein
MTSAERLVTIQMRISRLRFNICDSFAHSSFVISHNHSLETGKFIFALLAFLVGTTVNYTSSQYSDLLSRNFG